MVCVCVCGVLRCGCGVRMRMLGNSRKMWHCGECASLRRCGTLCMAWWLGGGRRVAAT